jgi:hypothetical protein
MGISCGTLPELLERICASVPWLGRKVQSSILPGKIHTPNNVIHKGLVHPLRPPRIGL